MYTIEIHIGSRLAYIGYSEDNSYLNEIIKLWKAVYPSADINIYKE